MKAVRFDKYGGIDVLNVVEVPRPEPTSKQLLVRMKAAGINIGEAAIREGVFAKQWPATFPSGQGRDLAGVIAKIGKDVASPRPSPEGEGGNFSIGDEVIGFTDKRASQAEYVVVESDHIIPRPPKVPWEQAGSLYVAGTTAYACVRAVSVDRGDTVVVSAAAGGVGSIVVQLAKYAGATVIGIASETNHKWLSAHGIIPIAYGDDMADRIRKASGGKVDAFIDTHGHGYVDLALGLKVAPDRINTIIDFESAKKYDVKTEGNSTAGNTEVLTKLAAFINSGFLEIPIAAVYPLADVRKAYEELEKHHTHGKIVLVP